MLCDKLRSESRGDNLSRKEAANEVWLGADYCGKFKQPVKHEIPSV